MMDVLRKSWPLIVILCLFIAVSWFTRTHLNVLLSHVDMTTHRYAMVFYIVLGIVTVIVPIVSILPLMPIAVYLWGWQVAGTITVGAWLIGSQIVFEIGRYYGKPLAEKFLKRLDIDSVKKAVEKPGLMNAIFIRFVIHHDIVSYAFAIFSSLNRWEFLLVTAIGVTPGAFMYAYFGTLPIWYQIGLATLGLVTFMVYLTLEKYFPRLPRTS